MSTIVPAVEYRVVFLFHCRLPSTDNSHTITHVFARLFLVVFTEP